MLRLMLNSWLTMFVECLSTHCPKLKYLHLSKNNLGVPGASTLARAVSRLQHHSRFGFVPPQHCLSKVYLNETNLGDEGLKAFCDSLEGVCNVWSLILSGNGIHSTGVSYLTDAVCSGKIVTVRTCVGEGIDLSDNPLGLEGCVVVCRMLSSSHCQAGSVVLYRCKLTTVGSGLPSANPVNLCNDIPHLTL